MIILRLTSPIPMSTTASTATTQTYNVDPVHSQVQFKVRHLGFSTVTGEFEEFDGRFELDPDDLSTLGGAAEIQAASVDTGDEERDGHLRSEDFFAAEAHPAIEFEAGEVSAVSGDDFTLTGDLTIRGTTRPIELDGTYLGEAQDPWGGSRVALELAGEIDRTEYGLTWNKALETGGFLVGEKVELTLTVQGVREEDE